jgi:hypothetical protein
MDTKHDIRAENCSRGNRLLAQPARKAIETRKTAGIALEDAEWSGRKEAMYLAKVERPMPKKAPIMLRIVASKCWASVS